MRELTAPLEAVQLSRRRRPAYKVLAFDPSLDSMSQVVCGASTQAPLDITQYCSNLNWTPARLTFTLEDPDGLFHPDLGGKRQYMADKAIIRLVEGDSQVDEADWINTFTGYIQGQIGWKMERRSQTMQANVSVYARDNNQAWKRRSITSKEYSVGTDLAVMFRDICTDLMGMADAELRIPSSLGLQFKHQVNQVVQMAPWEALTAILQAVGGVQFFDGDGRLTYYSKNLSRPEARVLTDYNKVVDYEIPERSQDVVNKVVVNFLDANLSKVPGSSQCLGTATITAGFFMPEIKVDCWWSDDHKQRAENTFMVVKQSCVTGVGRAYSSEPLGPWAKEGYEEIDEFHGRIKITVPLYSDLLFAAELIEYVALTMLMPDGVVTAGIGASGGETIPYGRLGQNIVLMGILATLMCIGTGNYEVWGTPYDYVYLKKQSIAVECNIDYWDEVEKSIDNDFIGSHDQADAIALLELTWERSSGFPRKLVIEDDLALEIGDMLRLPDGRKFFITNLSKQIQRGEVPLLRLDGFKVLAT
jgi:hypothetical protein